MIALWSNSFFLVFSVFLWRVYWLNLSLAAFVSKWSPYQFLTRALNGCMYLHCFIVEVSQYWRLLQVFFQLPRRFFCELPYECFFSNFYHRFCEIVDLCFQTLQKIYLMFSNAARSCLIFEGLLMCPTAFNLSRSISAPLADTKCSRK